jgi:DNA-binding NtrC family response regulator
MMAMTDTLDIQDFPAYLRTHGAQEEERQPLASAPEVGTLAEQERLLIIRALETAGGNQSQAARLLRIGRDALRYKLKKHNLESSVIARAGDGE